MSKKITKISLVLSLIISCSLLSISYAGVFSKDKAGTTGAQFLKIGCGARAIGMGEAYSAVADEVSAIYWNPAGLAQIGSRQVSAMHTMWLESINYDFLAYAQPLMEGSIGVSLNYLSMSKMDKLDENGVKDGTFSPYDGALNVAYAQKVGSITGGVNLKVIRQELDGDSATGFAVDLGTLHQLSDKLQAAVVVQNIGPEIKFIEESDPLPMSIRLGISARLVSKLVLALDGVAPIDNEPNLHVGCEYTLDAIRDFPIACRIGYKTTTASDLDALSGLSGGLGFYLRGLDIDYAWVPYGDLGDTHRISLGMKFGEKRESKIAKMRRHYMRGVKFYKLGKYRLAITQFKKVLKLEPNHKQSKNMIKKSQKRLLKVSRSR